MLMYFPNMAGVIIFGALMVVMVLVVPLEKIRKLAVFGLLSGVLLPFLVIHIMQNVLGLWIHRGIDPVTIADIPVFFAITWLPAVIMFAHFIVQYRSFVLVILLLMAVGGGVAGIQFLLIANNMLTFNNWVLFESFLLTMGIHLGLIGVLHLMGHLDLHNLLRG